ncbi:MAG: FecR family protein [Candidatus Cryptobacteroides sp.]
MVLKQPDFWDRLDITSVDMAEVDKSCDEVLSRAKKMEAAFDLKDGSAHRRKFFLRTLAGVAAAVALILVPALSVLYVHFLHNEAHTVVADYVEVCARKGEIREVILPDQSRVTLNSGSVLLYPEMFSDIRSVHLSGEAVFDVTASEEHPFVVRTADVNVRVHGTRFNVSSYPDENQVDVTLCRGAVRVSPSNDDANAVELLPDQNCRYDKSSGKCTVSNVSSAEYTGWESGSLSFHSQSIHSVARAISRRFNVNVYVTDGKYDKAVITAKFIHGETLEEQVSAICRLVPGMKYTVKDGNIYIR